MVCSGDGEELAGREEEAEAEVGRGNRHRGRAAAGVTVIDRSGRKVSTTVVACGHDLSSSLWRGAYLVALRKASKFGHSARTTACALGRYRLCR